MSLSGTSHVTLPPEDHPRYKSLMAREKLVEAADAVAR